MTEEMITLSHIELDQASVIQFIIDRRLASTGGTATKFKHQAGKTLTRALSHVVLLELLPNGAMSGTPWVLTFTNRHYRSSKPIISTLDRPSPVRNSPNFMISISQWKPDTSGSGETICAATKAVRVSGTSGARGTNGAVNT